MGKVKNYARFYALIKALPGDHEEIKENLVKVYTKGRTTSLREMSAGEYRRMCDSMDDERRTPGMSQNELIAALKERRSAVLKRIQKLGVDTQDWAAVDRFCMSPRIAGKRFSQLSLDELERMIPKLEAIARKPRRVVTPDPFADPELLNRLMNASRGQLPN